MLIIPKLRYFLSIILILTFYRALNAQFNNQSYFEYLEKQFHKESISTNRYLIDEFVNYLEIFPNRAREDDALWMLSLLQEQYKLYNAQLISLLKIVFLYPNSDFTPNARIEIHKLLTENQNISLNIKKDKILNAIDKKRSAKSYQDTYFDFLSFLYEIDVKELHSFLLDEIKTYFRIFSDNPVNGDMISFFAGNTFEQDNKIANAIACYRKIIALFPESSYRWKAQYQIGYLFYSRLDSTSSAMDNFLEVINSFPMQEEAVNAQFYLAEIYDKKLNNIDEAIQNYRLLIESFPDNPFRLTALKRVAELCRNSGRFEEAVTSYMQIFEEYPDTDTAPSALEHIISIYYNHLHKPARAAATLKLFGSYYKGHPKADEYFFQAAAIYANELKMPKEAREICVFIINNYPDGRFAEPARELLKKSGN